jgi:glycosyltransferase involved in cell wall biosynthesis
MTHVAANDKTRVLIAARWPVGGIRSYLRYTYGMLSPDEFDLSILGPKSPELEECGRVLEAYSPRIHACESSSMRHLLRGYSRALRDKKFDVVHSQGYSSAVAGALPVRLRGVPHLVSIHDMFTHALRRKWSVRLGRLGLAAALGMVDVVQATGTAVEANFREHMDLWPATRPRLVTLRNGIDITRFAGESRRDLHQELGLRADDFLIGFLGRFMAIKGFHVLIRAIAQLRGEAGLPCRPVVVAVGSGGFVREDKAAIEQQSLSEHFHFLPHTNDVAGTMRGLDVVVIPSFSEASPLLPMEAQCSGTPVIASATPGLLDVLKDSPAKIFPIGDASALADALRATMLAPASETNRSFRREAMSRFDAQRTARAIRALLLDLASGRSPVADSVKA